MFEEKSKKPANTAFKQQRLKSWQPLLTSKTVLPTLFAAGVFFAPLGGLFLYQSDTVNEIIIDYTNCKNANDSNQALDSSLYSYKFTDKGSDLFAPTIRYTEIEGKGICSIRFNVPIQLKTPIFLYYKLTNFYQNHRKYVKSLNYNQLYGDIITPLDATSCSPLGTVQILNETKFYYPCGLIANSMFNDTFLITFLNPPSSTESLEMPFKEQGIAWPTDKNRLGRTKMDVSKLIPPPNWKDRYPNGYTEENLFNPVEDEHFQVWMRTSWYPTFKKLYSSLKEGKLEAGYYEVNVTLNYDIMAYGGTKSIVITGTSFLGNKNPFMGMALILMGSICSLFGIIFLGWHFFKPRKIGDHDRLSWKNNEIY